MNRTVASRFAARLALAVALVFAAAAARAAKVTLDVAPSSSLLQAGKRQPAYLKVGIKGIGDKARASRPALNAAIVLDKSGSMTGEKIANAKQAARAFVSGLGPDDIIAIVTYDTEVSVVLPATKASEKESIYDAIDSINANGSTALFAGVSKGSAEIRKFFSASRVNRVVLLSDGIANVGPSAPSDLAALGRSLGKEGISVTTIGLGLDYNEDLLTKLASSSDGNHAFIDEKTDLAQVFKNELGAAQQVVAQEIIIKIKITAGVRPVRVLGREAEIDGQTIHLRLNSLYDGYDRNVVIEIEPPAGEPGQKLELAWAEVSYRDMETNEARKVEASTSVTYSASESEVAAAANPSVMVPVVTLIATEQNQIATQLRDEGKVDESRRAFLQNSDYLESQNKRYKSESLDRLQKLNKDGAKNLAPGAWNKQRKLNQEEGAASAGDSIRIKQ